MMLAEKCRNYETEEEKVLPFYTSSLTEEEEQSLNNSIFSDDQAEFKHVIL